MKTKSENRKAMPKFILIMIGALILGAILGVLIVFADGDWTTRLTESLADGLLTTAPWLLLAAGIVNILAVWLLYRKAKRIYQTVSDPEDEETLDRIERILNVAMVINNVCTIAGYFLVSIPFAGIEKIEISMFLLSLGAFILCMASMIIGQQKLVDFTKKLNPEKRGSVYDMKFAEKWYESCDEAERALICQSAFASYKATNTACLILWLALVLGNMLFDLGILPIAIVSILWLVSTLSYCIKAIQLEKRKKG